MEDKRNLPILVYLILTVLSAAYLLGVYLAAGSSGMDSIFKTGPASYATINIFVICACWGIAGAILFFLGRPALARRHILFIALFFLLSFFFLNVLREPHLAKRGDFGIYWNAVRRVETGKAMSRSWAYTPLLTSLLRPLYPLGSREASCYFKITNYAAVLLSYLLLYLVLQKYGFPRHAAAAFPFVLLIFSVPLARALAYQQVTIHVVNMILISLLFYGRNNLVSAAALCLAVNLKVTPAILILPFLYNREWRWLVFFVAVQVLIIAFTSWMCGIRYWGDFFHSGLRVMAFAYRNNSIDSFLFNLSRFLGIPFDKIASAAAKIVFLIISAVMWRASCEREVFYSGERRMGVVYNGFVPLLLFAVVVSPRIWAHYLIILSLPFLVMLKVIRGKGELALYLLSYVLIFLVPVFDLFPFSYHRLLGILICYRLCWVISMRPERAGVNILAWFERSVAAATCAWRVRREA